MCLTVKLLVMPAHTHGRLISHYGHFAVSAELIGFWSRSITRSRDVLYRIPIARVKGAKGHSACKFGREHTLTFAVHGRRDFSVHFSQTKKRDEALEQVLRFMGIAQEQRRSVQIISPTSLSPVPLSPTALSPTSSREDSPKSAPASQDAVSPDDMITTAATAAVSSQPSSRTTYPSPRPRSALMRNASSILAPLSRLPSAVQSSRNGPIIRALFPRAINVPNDVLLPMPSKHFVCLTIGSRGDVQPYIALGKALQKEGHKVTIVTHEEYKKWVTGFGIDHRTAGGDPGALMKLSVENKVSSDFWCSLAPLDAGHQRCSRLNFSRRAYQTWVFAFYHNLVTHLFP
jgi:sterol 3beta-glucosyltransferase